MDDRFSSIKNTRFLIALVAAFFTGIAQGGDYHALRIVSPGVDATVHDNRGRVSVVVEVEPALHAAAGDRIVLLLDGRSVATGSGEHFALGGIDRGTHTLQAQVTSADGVVRIASAPVSFQLWRASRLFPSRER